MYEIKVRVVEFSDRKYYQMQYCDPVTGRKKTRSTGVERTALKRDRTEAERVAAKWESELREGRYQSPSKITWAEFRERYESERLTGLAQKTDLKVQSVLNAVESILNPQRLLDLTAERVSYLQSKLRERKLAESTIAGHLAHLRAALQWAVNVGMLAKLPKVERPKRAKASKVMKGRPITLEEFERMLTKVEAGLMVTRKKKRKEPQRKLCEQSIRALKEKRQRVAASAASSWRHYLTGLWWSGLRLAESLELWWDRDDKLSVDLSGKFPMLRIPAELEKGHKDRLLPIAPEFANFLLKTPKAGRTGPVFNPKPLRDLGTRLTAHRVGEMISEIGRAAGIKVSADQSSGKLKFVSAHDLRRSFGERWATRIMPPDLMLLMRHESIETTMKFYVGRNAQTAAARLWESHAKLDSGNTSGNSSNVSAPSDQTAETANPSRQ